MFRNEPAADWLKINHRNVFGWVYSRLVAIVMMVSVVAWSSSSTRGSYWSRSCVRGGALGSSWRIMSRLMLGAWSSLRMLRIWDLMLWSLICLLCSRKSQAEHCSLLSANSFEFWFMSMENTAERWTVRQSKCSILKRRQGLCDDALWYVSVPGSQHFMIGSRENLFFNQRGDLKRYEKSLINIVFLELSQIKEVSANLPFVSSYSENYHIQCISKVELLREKRGWKI